MWQRFTERARMVVFFAQQEAGKLGHNYVMPEHMLLGLLRQDDSVALRILEMLKVEVTQMNEELLRKVERGEGRLGLDMQLTPRAKRVIDLAYDEARALNNNYIGTEHLLLGLIREGENLASRTLHKQGVELDATRQLVISLQDGESSQTPQFLQSGPRSGRGSVVSDRYKLRGTCLLSMADISPEQVTGIVQVSAWMKSLHQAERPFIHWEYPQSMAMVFEKPSLRTRVTFELGLRQLGGIPIVLGPEEIGLGQRESVEDAARNLERWVDGIMARVFDHSTLEQLAANCKIPVINGLSDREHPCQALTDLFTIHEKKGTLEGLKLAYIGDGNNVLHSLLLGGALVGMRVVAACPAGYQPDSAIVGQAHSLAPEGVPISVVLDPAEAVKDADVVYTDVWTSMGQESERETRLKAFEGYQVNAELMAQAKPDAVFMHCLPAHRGEEVTAEVIDGPQSVVFDQAENRLHVQKAIMALLLGA